MPRNGSGTYALPAGNPVVPNDVITSDWANDTLDDVAAALTDSMSRTGEGGMLAPFRIDDGTNNAPGLSFVLETSSGLYRAGSGEFWSVVSSVPIARYTLTGVLLPTGKNLTVGGAATVASTLGVTGAVTFGSTLTAAGMITASSFAGNLTGNVTAVSGTSAFYDVTVGHSLSMGGFIISALADPVADTDAATKQYVDSVAQGLSAKAPCLVATTANITLSGTQTIDGVAVVALDRVLVKNQTAPAENGIYVVAAGAWARSADANAWAELVSAFTFVTSGTANANNGYVCTVAPGGTLGVTAVTWVQFSGAGQITAGAGLTKVGNTIDVVTANSGRIVVNADSIDLASGIVTPGTYTKVTVDTYGRVTVGANPTTLAGYGITDAYTTTYIDALFGSTASAATSAAAAATSAGASATSAAAALASENAAAATYDAFDDRYLGSKTSDPTVDNDGNPLISGALYWNSVAAQMRVYNLALTSWIAAYLPASAYVAGPGSSTDNAVMRWDGTTGAVAQNSGVTISDANLVTTAGGVNLSGASAPLQVGGSAGTAGNVLTSAGAGATPTWGAGPSATTLYTFTAKTTTYSAVAGDVIVATTGAFTITLPTMTAGQYAVVARNQTSGDTTIGRNSQTIDGVAANFTMDVNKMIILFTCTGTGTIETRFIGVYPT
jgi:hypothetical protein